MDRQWITSFHNTASLEGGPCDSVTWTFPIRYVSFRGKSFSPLPCNITLLLTHLLLVYGGLFVQLLQGPLGFYKGMAAPVVGVTPIFALSFFGFNVGKALQQDKPDDPLTLVTVYLFMILRFGT